jgi:hypothetical protein
MSEVNLDIFMASSRKRQKRPLDETVEALDPLETEERGTRWGKSLKDRAKGGSSRARRAATKEPSHPADDVAVTPPRPPPSGYDLDQLNYHIELECFGKDLQNAANAVFSGDRRSKYTQV